MKPVYDDGPAGVAFLGLVPEAQCDLLRSVLEAGRKSLGEAWAGSSAKREIFWINLWQRSGGPPPLPLEGATEIDAWARGLAERAYEGENAECDGYGFIINPIGSKAQPWHVDYGRDYSTLFIPLSQLTPENCTQYAVPPPNTQVVIHPGSHSNSELVDLNALMEGCDYVSIRQLLVRPFSIIKLDFGTIHRGVANTGGFERVMFWISAIRRGSVVPVEPPIEVLDETGRSLSRRQDPETRRTAGK